MAKQRRTQAAMTEARLERAVVAAAYVVARHGPVYAPIFERLERDLSEFRARQDPVERARQFLAQHAIPAPTTPGRLLSPV